MTSRPSIDSNAGDSAKLPAEDTHEEPKPVISSSDPKPLQAPPVEAISDGWSDDDWSVPPPPPVVKKESVEAIAPISVKPEPKTKRARRKLKQSEELPVKKEEVADSDEDAFDWDDDSIWKKESPVDKEKAPKKAPLLPSVPKPKLELSDDDWEDVPTKPDLPPKHREEVTDDWQDVPQKPDLPPKRKVSDDSDWEDVPVKPTPQRKSPQETKKTGVVSDDGWEDVPQKPILPPKRKEVSDDWEEVPPQPKKLEAISDDDWNETPLRINPPPATKRQMRLRGRAVVAPKRAGDTRSVRNETPRKVVPRVVKAAPRATEVLSDDLDEMTGAAASSDDWDDVPQMSTEMKKKLSDDWDDVPTKPDMPPKREVESDDWEDVPTKPTQRKGAQETKKMEAISDDDWEDVPQIPTQMKKKTSDDWEDKPKKLETISDDDDWNETPRASRKPSQPKPTTLSDDWEDVPQQPKKLEAISDDDWEDVPPKPVQVKNRKPVIDDWEDVPQEPRTRRPTRQSKNETPLPPKQQRNSPGTKDNLFSDLFDGYDFSKMNMEPTKPLSIEELLSMGKTDHDRSANKDDTERRKRIEECLNGLPKLEYLGLSVRVSFLLSPVGHSVLVFLMCILFLLSYTHNGRGSEQPRLQP